MIDYYPDGWVVVKITRETDNLLIYKVFASWGGGYLNGDSWKLNSGIQSVAETETDYEFTGHSGSVYGCSKRGYNRLTSYSMGVLNRVIEQAKEEGIVTEIMPEETDWMKLEYRQ